MKYFNISLHRTGTQSFHQYCIDIGKSSFHFLTDDDVVFVDTLPYNKDSTNIIWDIYQKYLHNFECLSDFPVPLFLDKLLEYYPESSYILFIRPFDKWYNSVSNHFDHLRKTSPSKLIVDKLFYLKYGNDRKSLEDFNINDYFYTYNNYLNAISNYNIKNLTIINLEDSDEATQKLNALFNVQNVSFTKSDYLKKYKSN